MRSPKKKEVTEGLKKWVKDKIYNFDIFLCFKKGVIYKYIIGTLKFFIIIFACSFFLFSFKIKFKNHEVPRPCSGLAVIK